MTPARTALPDGALARELAADAGQLLLSIRRRLGSGGGPEPHPAEPDRVKEVRDEGDRRSNELLLAALDRDRPGDAVLSEESRDDASRLDAERVWIIDPLDGTREFGEPPRTDWAVHVALTAGSRPVAGAVALPAEGLVFSTEAPPEVAGGRSGPIRLVVSRTRPPPAATYLADRLDAELVEMGSAGAKAMSVITGSSDVYVHSGGQYEWDSCAPVAVALAAGLHCSRIDGRELLYNNADPYLPDLLVCRPELADPVLKALDDFDA